MKDNKDNEKVIIDAKYEKYSDPKDYDENKFWDKIKNVFKKAGREIIELVLKMYYVAQDVDTPLWAKSAIYGGLAYFISPIDVIPDFIPIAGYTDDLAALGAIWKAMKDYCKPKHLQQAQDKIKEWFD